MNSPATLVREARERAHLSRRALALRAGVTASTVSRIEAAAMDPTVGMLSRLLEAAGVRLRLTVVELELAPTLADLSDAAKWSHLGASVDWTRLRAVLDWVAQHPSRSGEVITARPPRSGSELVDCLLAGIAEKLADDAGLDRPSWTAQVPGLTTRWELPGTPRMLIRARAATPPQLAVRNITLAVGDLWRDVA